MDVTDHKTDSIHHNYNKCFADTSSLLTGSTDEAQNSYRDSKYACLEVLARLRVWGDESKAELPAEIRGSLDDVLKNEPRMKRVVLRNLLRIQKNIAKCARGDDGVPDIDDEEDDSDTSAEGDTYEDVGLPKPHPCVLQLNQDMASLLQISLLIRQPGYERKYLHSTGTTDISSTVAGFADSDLIHVAEKLRSWRHTHKIVNSAEACSAAVSIPTPDNLGDFPNHQIVLIQRLAKANTRRREQLRYWAKHPDVAHDFVGATTGPNGGNKQKVGSKISGSKTSALQSVGLTDGMPESMKTRDTFSTRMESDIRGKSSASNNSQMRYEKSIMGNRRTNQVPRIPHIATDAVSFECPYCHGRISVKRMRRREDWKRHVLRDLRAYVCTFSDCTNPDKQYSTQQDWFNHERQVHRRQWSCGQHELHYNSPELLVDHLNREHLGEIPQEHTQSFIALSERSTDRNINTPCPMCPEVRPLVELEGHLAEHLQSIALFVLGANIDADDDEESGKVGSTAINEISSQLWSHPSDLTKGSQGSPGILLGESSESEEDLENLPRRRSSAALKNAEMTPEQMWFDKAVQKVFLAPNQYATVAVLVVRWDDAVDTDKEGHDIEIALLREVFECNFGFKYEEARLRTSSGKRSQHDLNAAIAHHVQMHDSANSLLIICYIGHALFRGSEDDRVLELSANSQGMHNATADWHKAEQVLTDSAEADVLAIFDCGYASNTLPGDAEDASNAYKGDAKNHRTYQWIAAMPKNFATLAPGPNSFISRLIISLRELLKASQGGGFSTGELVASMNMQTGSSTTRRVLPAILHDDSEENSDHHIQLARLDDKAVDLKGEMHDTQPVEEALNSSIHTMGTSSLSKAD